MCDVSLAGFFFHQQLKRKEKIRPVTVSRGGLGPPKKKFFEKKIFFWKNYIFWPQKCFFIFFRKIEIFLISKLFLVFFYRYFWPRYDFLNFGQIWLRPNIYMAIYAKIFVAPLFFSSYVKQVGKLYWFWNFGPNLRGTVTILGDLCWNGSCIVLGSSFTMVPFTLSWAQNGRHFDCSDCFMTLTFHSRTSKALRGPINLAIWSGKSW